MILILKKKTVVAVAQFVDVVASTVASVTAIVRSFSFFSHTPIIRTRQILFVNSIVVFFPMITELIFLFLMYSKVL